jgi:uroporphyrinogen-III synthase
MHQNRIKILCTRELQAELIAVAAQAGIDLDSIPFIETRASVSERTAARISSLSKERANVVFTSVKAIESVLPYLDNPQPDWKIYCMEGEGSRKISEHFGAGHIAGTGNNAAELAARINLKNNSEKLFFFSGNLRRAELPAYFETHGIEWEELPVYETSLRPQKLHTKYDGYIFFSPSAVRSFFTDNAVDEPAVFFSIGHSTATELRKYTNKKIISSKQPDARQLIRELIDYYSENPVKR